MLDPIRDLLLGTHCLGCARPGRLVCGPCLVHLDVAPFVCWPTPTPPGLATPWAAAAYDGLARDLVLGLKERGLLPLGGLVAALLAGSVAAALGPAPTAPTTPTTPPGTSWLLVPVPSRRTTVRARGHDATRTVTEAAAVLLRARGYAVAAAPLLALRTGVVDQSGLDALARRRNLAGSMTCPSGPLRRLARRGLRARAVVCDDVVTTGSTLREAQRALEAVGLSVHAGAAVAATALRAPPRRPPGRTSPEGGGGHPGRIVP